MAAVSSPFNSSGLLPLINIPIKLAQLVVYVSGRLLGDLTAY